MPRIGDVDERRTIVFDHVRQRVESFAAAVRHVEDVTAILVFDPPVIRAVPALIVVESHHFHVPDGFLIESFGRRHVQRLKAGCALWGQRLFDGGEITAVRWKGLCPDDIARSEGESKNSDGRQKPARTRQTQMIEQGEPPLNSVSTGARRFFIVEFKAYG
jgi:hypothetical protein